MRPKPAARRPIRPRPGLLLRRQPRVRWALTVVVALGAGGTVARTVDRAERAAEAWGTSVPVLVVTDDVAAGDALAQATEVMERPAAVVPDGALRELPDGARASQPVLRGEVLQRGHLAPRGATALAARLPAGTRAVAIPAEPGTTPSLRIGDVVDVLVALPPEAAGGGPPGFALVRQAPVVDVGEVAITVAVPVDDAPRVAVALGQGAVTLALAPPT